MIYRKKFMIHTFEVDFRGKALLTTLLNFLQDAAGEHAARLGFGMDDLFRKNQTWLLSRYHIKIHGYPVLGETVEVETWPSGRAGNFALRDFEVRGPGGRPVAAATTSWILFHVGRRQIESLQEHLPDRISIERRALEDGFPPLPKIEETENEVGLRVNFSDLDFNRHVNNVVYIQWAMEAVPAAILQSKRPVDVEVLYKAEAFYGDEILSRLRSIGREGEPAFIHQIVKKQTSAELARLRTHWD
jgi:acyl-ACP thioesterase